MAKPGHEVPIVGGDRFVNRLRPVDEVHLVDCEDEMTNAEVGKNGGVPPGLFGQTLAGVDEDHGKIGCRRAGSHVAGILFVPRGIGDDEGASGGRECAISNIDRYALFAFRLQAVHQQRQVQCAVEAAMLPAVLSQPGQLVLVDETGIVEQAADQRRFPVIDAAAGDETQEVPRRAGVQSGATRRIDPGAVGHQK